MLTLLTIIVAISFAVFKNVQEFKDQNTAVQEEKKEVLGIVDGYLIDEDGMLLQRNTSSDYPEIKIETQSARGGEKIQGEEIKKTLAVLKELKKLNLEVDRVEVYNRERMDLIFRNSIKVFYNSAVDPYTFASSLQFMFSRFKIDGKMPAQIDFRFRKPVVKF